MKSSKFGLYVFVASPFLPVPITLQPLKMIVKEIKKDMKILYFIPETFREMYNRSTIPYYTINTMQSTGICGLLVTQCHHAFQSVCNVENEVVDILRCRVYVFHIPCGET